MAKPGDFFVGVTDLFSVLLPGAVVSFVAMRAEQSLNPPADLFGLLELKDAAGYTAFLVSSFLLGHLVDMVGASVLDSVYDLLYADFMRCRTGFRSWLKGIPRRLATVARDWYRRHLLDLSIPKPDDAAGKTMDPIYVAALSLAGPKPARDRLYQWCRDWLQVRSPQALHEPDRQQANSKFFRALVVVAGVFAVLFWALPSFRSTYSGSVARDVVWMASCLLVMGLSFLRYSDLRWKAVQHVYRLYVIVRHCEAQGPAGENRPFSNEWRNDADSGSGDD
jgi:hypothetical protein